MQYIGILVPVCSRNENYKSALDIPLNKYLLPSFLKSRDEGYEYKFYIGVDDNDDFYNKNLSVLGEMLGDNFLFYILKDCNHKPAHAWNKLLKVAYEDGCDYFFQVGDDIEILNSGWTNAFIKQLNTWDNIGVVGPCEHINYNNRMSSSNKKIVIENAFFHRKHFEIFKTLFHQGINNWYCDDWISDVYASVNKRKMMTDILVKNHTRGVRYDEQKILPHYERYLQEGIRLLPPCLKTTPKLIDCFIFYNELDLLNIRLEELYDVVDHFVIVEANSTFSGKPKGWNYELNKDRFVKHADKIIYIKVDDMPNNGDAWVNEIHQRNAIKRCYEQFDDTDIIIISDVDEIPSSKVIKSIRENPSLVPIRLEMAFYNYNFNCKISLTQQNLPVVYHLKDVRGISPQNARENYIKVIPNSGWHLSWFGDVDFCINKIRNFAHQELNTDNIITKLSERKNKYEDYYPESGRNWKFNHVFLDTTLPECVLDRRFGFIEKYIDQPFRIAFVSYADSVFKKSGERIVKEAWSSGLFSSVKCYSRNDLDSGFVARNSYLLSFKRLGGYCCWKPYIILKTMKEIGEGEWILYADAGCSLVNDRRNQVIERIIEMERLGKEITAYELTHLEKTWTKGDVFKFMGINESSWIYNSNQFMDGVMLIKNTEFSRGLMKQAMDIIEKNHSLVDDSPSTTPNDPTFIENRHDQSILSLLRKLNKEKVLILSDETYHGSDFIQATRLRE